MKRVGRGQDTSAQRTSLLTIINYLVCENVSKEYKRYDNGKTSSQINKFKLNTQVWLSTGVLDDDKLELYYIQLEELLKNLPKTAETMIIRDFNAKKGQKQ